MNYSAKVMQYFHNPTRTGQLENYHGIGMAGNPDCGDFVEMTVYISKDNQKVEAIRHRIKGCPAAFATTGITAEIAEGLRIEDALKITDQQVFDALDGLPESKFHCSLLAVRSLQLAIQDAILKRLFKKVGIVTSDAEFEQMKSDGRLGEYLGLTTGEIGHNCDGCCEASGIRC